MPNKKKFVKHPFTVPFIIAGICVVVGGGIGISMHLMNQETVKSLSINEVCTRNESVIADPNEKYYDYIELYNTSSETISLKGYGLSDDASSPYKYSFTNTILLPPQESLLLFATKKGHDENTKYTGFSLDADVENTLYLTDSNGTLVDEILIPVLKQDIAYGRMTDGSSHVTMLYPSPNASNTTAEVYHNVEKPALSLPAGFYDEGTELTMETANRDLKIYYTLDSTIPSEESSVYQSGIVLTNPTSQENVYHNFTNVTLNNSYVPPTEPVDKAVVVKAVAVDADGNRSDVVTSTYYVDLAQNEKYQNGLMVSLTTEPANLFDDETGIYVTGAAYDAWFENGQNGDAPLANFQVEGREAERPAVVEITDQNNNILVSQDIGIRIQGASARGKSQKRFSLFARKDYGTEKYFPYDFFGNDVKTHSLLLRNSFIDAFIQSFMEGTAVTTQRALPAHLFLEGEYWGDYYLQEKYSDDYFEQYYDVDNDNVVVIKNWAVDVGKESDMSGYWSFYHEISDNDMSIPSNYEKACSLMDMDSFIDFVSAQIYFCNMDWGSEKMLFWKVREPENDTYGDGRWRFLMYDCDCLGWGKTLSGLCNSESVAAIDSFSTKMPYLATSAVSTAMFHSLLQNPAFKEAFIARFTELANTTFSYENASRKLQEWNINDANGFYDTFFKERHDYIMKYMEDALVTGSGVSETTDGESSTENN